MPINVFVSDVKSCTLTPKSHSLTWPLLLISMLEGLMSVGEREREGGGRDGERGNEGKERGAN